jgi:hypothetical protein
LVRFSNLAAAAPATEVPFLTDSDSGGTDIPRRYLVIASGSATQSGLALIRASKSIVS